MTNSSTSHTTHQTENKYGIRPTHPYSRRELASLLNVCYTTIRRLVLSGNLLETRIGGIHRIYGSDALDYLERAQATYNPILPDHQVPDDCRLNLERFRQNRLQRKDSA